MGNTASGKKRPGKLKLPPCPDFCPAGIEFLMSAKLSQNKKHIFLIGPPNSGKTTLFNWLTGFKQKAINYPGSTVFLSVGELLEKYKLFADVTDSPGLYSLFSQLESEKASRQSLFKKEQIVVLVLDASKLEAQLPLFFQLKSAGFCPLIVLTMEDLLPKKSKINTRQLAQLLKSPVVSVQGLIGSGMDELTNHLRNFPMTNPRSVKEISDWDQKKYNESLNQSKDIVRQSLKRGGERENIFHSQKWDRFFLHPQRGLFLLALIMFGLFSSLFWLAEPFMSVIDRAFSFLIAQTKQSLSAYPQAADFVSHGLLSSFGAVLIFVPQIFILFAGISLLEDSGYLARAVALMDGPLSKIGLSGRSFVPFLSGFACAIPSILLARNLSSKRERLMTFFAVPFMTCSARLPVYALLLSFLFYGQSAWKPGLVLSLIYFASFFLGMLAVFFLNRFLKKEEEEIFLLDLPVYRRPVLKKVLQNASQRTKHYLVKAGPAIFVVALAIWLLSSFPFQPGLSPAERIQQSYAGQIGQVIEPLFSAMGLDWRVGTALIAAFAAREVFVSSLVLIFSLSFVGEGALTHSLLMKSAHHLDGSLIFTPASVTALIVFFMFSLQCLSTTAIVYKESGSLKLALAQFFALNILAWLAAVLSYQSLSWLL